MRLIEGQLKPLLRIGLAFILVWFFFGMTSGILTGLLRLGIVTSLSFGSWILIMRVFYPATRENLK